MNTETKDMTRVAIATSTSSTPPVLAKSESSSDEAIWTTSEAADIADQLNPKPAFLSPFEGGARVFEGGGRSAAGTLSSTQSTSGVAERFDATSSTPRSAGHPLQRGKGTAPSESSGGGEGGPGNAGIPARIFSHLGQLLAYPDANTAAIAGALAQQLRSDFPKAAKALAAFAEETLALTPEHLEESYARAFDMSPLAVPYTGVYLFGEDDRNRARFMAGLKICFDNADRDLQGELPDHIAVVLRHADALRDEDWDDLVRFCLHGPLKAMRQALDRAEHPYRHVIHAVQQVLATLYPEEFKSC